MGRALMVQGTASHVGKSVLVAGLCRLFYQEGIRVAPFKAQNMALNSFATPDGGEIGRAQAVQAEAARVIPCVAMNPILLKPEGQARSQVVVSGKVLGSMDAAEYHRRKGELWPIVEASLRELLDEFELVVIEGAGSPVEVNLKDADIVNMRVARAVSAPVILVADIDRGGVFAALVGTMELLEPPERDLVAGFIVNKFRGDPTLFSPGVRFIEERLERPVLGVVPWIEELGLAEEDSLGVPSFGFRVPTSQAPGSELGTRNSELDIVVIRLPHMANFDDFDPLRTRPGVCVRFVERPEDLGVPDLVILPGTKTTRADLNFLRDRGLDRAIVGHAARGGCTLGICGGYQMLGQRIDDPDGVEGTPGSVDGLGLLPAVTRYETTKRTIQVHGTVVDERGPLAAARNTPVTAYEIHMGRTNAEGPSLFSLADADGGSRPEGVRSIDGRVLGTYLHALFHNTAVRESVLGWLAAEKAVSLPPDPSSGDPYDRLADVLRAAVDVERLRQIALA
jgi:adenosylcobyric acid synthase